MPAALDVQAAAGSTNVCLKISDKSGVPDGIRTGFVLGLSA
jgi:hypothetical protein